MNMYAALLHDIFGRIFRQPKLIGVTFYPAQCHLDALLENIAKLSSELHTTAAWHIGNFDKQDGTISPRTIGHEASHDTWTAIYIVSIGSTSKPEICVSRLAVNAASFTLR